MRFVLLLLGLLLTTEAAPKENCYELNPKEDICRIPGELGQVPAYSSANFSNATAFLAVNERQRRLIAGLLPGKLHVPCGGKARTEEVSSWPAGVGGTGVDRTLLITLVPAFGGSTALQDLILSNSRIASLCRGNMWQCEGFNFGHRNETNIKIYPRVAQHWNALSGTGEILETPFYLSIHVMAQHFQIRNSVLDMLTFTEASVAGNLWDAVATWRRIWDLQKPVLLDKSPNLWYHAIERLHDALLRYPGWWPVRKVRPVYALMWKPLCLEALSHNFNDKFKQAPFHTLQHHVEITEKHVKHVKWAKRVGARMVVINYADLLWRPGVAIARLKALLPCVADVGFDARWTPKESVDTYPGNHLKTTSSTFSYGKSHPPASQCYNLESSRCRFSTECWEKYRVSFMQEKAARNNSLPHSNQSQALASLLKRHELAANVLLDAAEINV